MELQEKLNILRKQHKLTQMELANELEVSRQAISKWEQGTALPSTENLIRLAELYGVPLDVLVKNDLSLDQISGTNMQAEVSAKQRTIKRVLVVLIGLCAILIGITVFALLSKEPEGIPIEDLDSDIIEIDDIFDMGP